MLGVCISHKTILHRSYQFKMLSYQATSTRELKSKARTQDLKEILIGSCIKRKVIRPEQVLDDKTCDQFVDHLFDVWTNKNDTDISIIDYDPWLKFIDFSPEHDRAIFWSGVPSSLVDDYANSGSRLVNLEATPAGGLMADLTFCADDQ